MRLNDPTVSGWNSPVDVESKTKVPSVMDDPREQSVAKVYATAYLDAAGESEAQAAVEELGSFIDDVLGTQPELDRLLRGTSLGRDDKLKLIDRILSGRASEKFISLLKVLARHDRLALLPAIRHVADLE